MFDPFLFFKLDIGFFPFEYFYSYDKFQGTELPSNDLFFSEMKYNYSSHKFNRYQQLKHILENQVNDVKKIFWYVATSNAFCLWAIA